MKTYLLQTNSGIMRVRYGVLLVLAASRFAAAAASEPNAADPSSGYRTSEFQLAIWNSPNFQKQFAESYMAETEIEPRVTIEEREQMLKVMELISSDKSEDAAKMLQKEMSRNNAASAVYDFTLANIYFQQADSEGITEEIRNDKLLQAASFYQNAVQKYPKFLRAWRNLALIHVRKGEFEKAISALTCVVELGGHDAITYGLLGYAYASVENNLCAESAYRMAILLDPTTTDWKMGLARSFFKQERFAEAAALCRLLIKEYPDRADFWLLMANAYIGLNQSLKAAEIFEMADYLGKSTPETLRMLGDIYINQELYEMAADAYIKAMEKYPQDKVNQPIRAAKLLIARSAFKEGRRLIDHIEKKYGTHLDMEARKDLLKLKARLAVAEESTDQEEVRILEEIVALDPLDGEALILLGRHSARTGDLEKAVFYYERAASIEAFEADAKIQHAQLLVRQGKYNEALPLLRRAQQINPRDNVQEYLEQVERVAKSR